MTAGRASCFGRRRTSRRRESTTRSARQNRRSSRAPRPPRLFGHHGNALHPREGAQARVLRLRALLELWRRERPRTGASTSADGALACAHGAPETLNPSKNRVSEKPRF